MKIILTFSTVDIHDKALTEVLEQDKDFALKVALANEQEYHSMMDEKGSELCGFINKFAPEGWITIYFDTVTLEAKVIPYDQTDTGHY